MLLFDIKKYIMWIQDVLLTLTFRGQWALTLQPVMCLSCISFLWRVMSTSTTQSWGLHNVWMGEFKMHWALGCHFWFITDFSSFSISSLVAFLGRCVSAPLIWIPVCKNPFGDVAHFPSFLFLVCPSLSLSYFPSHCSAVLFLLSLNTSFDDSGMMSDSWNLYFLHRYACNYFYF